MPFLWRRKRGSRRGDAGKREALNGISVHKELTIPTHFRCPISLNLMKDPVSLSTGITYDRESIEKWMDAGQVTCPVSNQVLRNFDRIPNHSMRKMIQDWCVENKSHGIERIPTPRIPICPCDVSAFCARILAATQARDETTCHELLGKIKNLAKDSERNKLCIVGNGIGSALANVFDSFARVSVDKHMSLLKEILSILTWSFPLGQDGVSTLKSMVSLHCIARFLKSKSHDLSTTQNTIFVLKELIFEDQSTVKGLMQIEGIEGTLLHVLEMPIAPKATQACLIVIHHVMSQQEKANPTCNTPVLVLIS